MRAERELWCAVINQALTDIAYLGPRFVERGTLAERYLAMEQAKSWVGTRDYREVCHHAGFDPQYLLPKFEAAIKKSDRLWSKRK